MEKMSFGELVRNQRKAKGWSLEKLSEGICSRNTLSRIENGLQAPGREVFYRLMEKLGWRGFSYSDLERGVDLKVAKLRKEILQCLEYRMVENMDELLWEFKQIIDEDDWDQQMFLSMTQLVWERQCLLAVIQEGAIGSTERFRQLRLHEDEILEKDEAILEQCVVIMKHRHGSFNPRMVELLEGVDATDALLLNCLGVSYARTGKYQEAISIYAVLLRLVEENELISEANHKQMAVYYNNQAVCAFRAGLKQEALKSIEKATCQICLGGNSITLIRCLRTKAEILRSLHELDDYRITHHMIQRINRLQKKKAFLIEDMENFWMESLEIMTF